MTRVSYPELVTGSSERDERCWAALVYPRGDRNVAVVGLPLSPRPDRMGQVAGMRVEPPTYLLRLLEQVHAPRWVAVQLRLQPQAVAPRVREIRLEVL